jgi:hypothetical protein
MDGCFVVSTDGSARVLHLPDGRLRMYLYERYQDNDAASSHKQLGA